MLQEFRAKLAMEGKDPEAIAREVAMAWALGELPKMEGVGFGHMWSAGQHPGANVGAGGATHDGLRSRLQELDAWRQ